MQVKKTSLPGVQLIEPKVFGDARGFFFETWQQDRYHEAGLPKVFVQDNCSFSSKGVLRGLHFQHPRSQGKLVSVLQGEIYDVLVDIRVGSPTYGKWEGFKLSGENHHQLWVPAGFAHGFCVTSETALVLYKVDQFYYPAEEASLLWNDPSLNIEWPNLEVQLSAKDLKGKRLKEFTPVELPVYKP